jgi:hypothetical protein
MLNAAGPLTSTWLIKICSTANAMKIPTLKIERTLVRSVGAAFALSQPSVVVKSPTQPKPLHARRRSQAGPLIASGMTAVDITARPAGAA